jgi:hypothetical protein
MSRASAIERVRDAQADWEAAFRAHEDVVPALAPFAERLRATSGAAGKQAAAFEYAAENGLTTLAKDTVRRRPPPETWSRFDAAITNWQDAWQSGSTLTVAQALRRLATLTEMLADEVDELRRVESADASTSAQPSIRSASA